LVSLEEDYPGPHTTPRALLALSDELAYVRHASLHLLGRRKDPTTVDAFVQALDEADLHLRARVVQYAGDFACERHIETFRRFAKQTRDWQEAKAAEAVVQRLLVRFPPKQEG
jgi:HEAT repeat protein